ncbi:hypothetical protein IFM89_031611 [Coptis chinensis]|uniref:Uncharacterized protein n=1 Tax=Coptis chinensis TaxID=261450 RepID=A0A835HCR9_9MAGN|nr:hypothetical protein IFM89_031611 [Coptis chinensis]
MGVDLRNLPVIRQDERDCSVRKEDLKGNFSVSSKISSHPRKNTTMDWRQQVWNEYVHPRTCRGRLWKLCQKCRGNRRRHATQRPSMMAQMLLGLSVEENLRQRHMGGPQIRKGPMGVGGMAVLVSEALQI